MANFNQFFPQDTPGAINGQTYNEGDIVVFNDNYYGATATVTLSDPIVETDFDTGWALLSGGDAAVAAAVDDLNSTDNIMFWSGTQAEYNAITTKDENTIYYITDSGEVVGGLVVQDSGTEEGTSITTLNFNDNLDVTVTGNVATINAEAGGGGINPVIDSVTFINDYTADPGGTVTAVGTNHAPLDEVSYIEIAGSTFTSLAGTDPTVTLRIGGTDVDLSEFPVSTQSIRATIPAQGLTTDPTTATLIVTNALGGVSEPFEITFSAGPSLTSDGTFVAPEEGMVSVTLTAVTNDGSTAVFTAVSTLPDWLTLTDNGDNTATVSGIVPDGTMPGTNPYIIQAREGDRTFTQITLNIGAGSAVFSQSLGGSVLSDRNRHIRGNSPTSTETNYAWSVWFKLANLSYPRTVSIFGTLVNNGFNLTGLSLDTNNQLLVSAANTNTSTGVFLRDTSAWYHAVMKVTAGGTPEVWINGVSISNTGSTGGGTLRGDTNGSTYYGTNGLSPNNNDINGVYFAQVIHVDGTNGFTGTFADLNAESFGEFSDEGYWQPVQYPLGATGDQGHIYNFNDDTDVQLDSSTNGNTGNFGSVVRISDTVTDNYATFLSRTVHGISDFTSFSNGNRTATTAASFSQNEFEYTHRIPKEGKYYFELDVNISVSGTFDLVHASPIAVLLENTSNRVINGYWEFRSDGTVAGLTATGAAVADPDDVENIGVALDMDLGTVQFYIDGVASGESYTINNFDDVSDSGYILSGNIRTTATLNSGQTDFDLTTLPTGFGTLSSATLPDPTLVPGEHFQAGIYTGNRTTLPSITTGFTPDFIWFSQRSGGDHPQIYDTIRGGTSRQYTTGIAGWGANTDAVTFNSDGFTVGADGAQQINAAGRLMEYYAFRAGGAAAANNDGTVQTMVSANTDAGFSMVNWTATGSGSTTTRGHGLSQAPEIIILAAEGSSNMWTSIDGITGNSGEYINTSMTGSSNTIAGQFGDATDSVFSIRENVFTGTGGVVAYCWHSVPGYSDIGQYTGNGNGDGPFINCGFKPAFVWIKAIDSVGTGNGNFYSYNSAINPHNPVDLKNRMNRVDNEINSAGGYNLDFLSNGFKHISGNADTNADGVRFMYMAFAESPFKYSLGR